MSMNFTIGNYGYRGINLTQEFVFKPDDLLTLGANLAIMPTVNFSRIMTIDDHSNEELANLDPVFSHPITWTHSTLTAGLLAAIAAIGIYLCKMRCAKVITIHARTTSEAIELERT